jgi:uncharacterized membrane protein YqgA involved in biofilm formation
MATHRAARPPVARALLDPFSLAVLAGTLAAGVVFGLFPSVIVIGVAAYAAAAAVTLRAERT